MRIEIIQARNKKNASGWVEPAIGRCHCGGEVYLSSPLDNKCEVKTCRRFYNMVGQEVVDPDTLLGRQLRAEDDRNADDYEGDSVGNWGNY